MDNLKLEIQGMSCGHCVNAVRGALERLPGVKVEQVNIGSATLAYDPAQTTAGQIVDAVNDEGYTAEAAPAA